MAISFLRGPPEEARLTFSTSRASRNETGNAVLHNGVKPDPRLDSFGDLPHGVFRNGRDLKVLLDPARNLRCGQERRPALDSPRQQDLRRRLVDSPGDGG